MNCLVNYIDSNYSVNFAVNSVGVVLGKVHGGVSRWSSRGSLRYSSFRLLPNKRLDRGLGEDSLLRRKLAVMLEMLNVEMSTR